MQCYAERLVRWEEKQERKKGPALQMTTLCLAKIYSRVATLIVDFMSRFAGLSKPALSSVLRGGLDQCTGPCVFMDRHYREWLEDRVADDAFDIWVRAAGVYMALACHVVS